MSRPLEARTNSRETVRNSHVFLGTKTIGFTILIVEDVRRVDGSVVVQPVTSALPIPVVHGGTPISFRYVELTPAVEVCTNS